MLSEYECDSLIPRYLNTHAHCLYMARHHKSPAHKAWWLKEASWYRIQIMRIKRQQKARK